MMNLLCSGRSCSMDVLPPLFTNVGFVTHLNAHLRDSLRIADMSLLSVLVTDTKSVLDLIQYTVFSSSRIFK